MMNAKDYEKKLEKELLPYIKRQLLFAYRDGYQQAFIERYMQEYNIKEGNLADFGLSSGTIWIIRSGNLTFREAKECGLRFPTKEQIDELLKCKWRFEPYDYWHCHVRGPNGYEVGIFDSYRNKLFVWTEESSEDADFMVSCYLYVDDESKKHTFEQTKVYSGDRYSTLFVLPKELKG